MKILQRNRRLYIRLCVYIHDICKIVRLYRKISGRGIKKEDYPNVVVACAYGGIVAEGHSRQCLDILREEVNYELSLLNELKKYGNPPEVKEVNGTKKFIGTCAEDMAANKVLQKQKLRNPSYIPKLNDLVFTLPIRPRTLEHIQMCDTCKNIFNENNIIDANYICCRKIIKTHTT